jgi:hypothetical protein
VVSVRTSVDAVLGDDTSWRAETARALADQVDETGSASAARELRAVMAAIDEAGNAKAGDELDEFRARRAARPAG